MSILTDKTIKPVLLRNNKNNSFISPVTDAQYVQYTNPLLGGTYLNHGVSATWSVRTVREALDMLSSIDARDLYIVNFIWDGTNHAISCEQTYQSVLAAWNSKKTIIGKLVASGTNSDSSSWDRFSQGSYMNTFICYYDDRDNFVFVSYSSSEGIFLINYSSSNINFTTSIPWALASHNHSAGTHSSGTYYLLGVTGTSAQQYKYNSAVYVSGGNTLRATTFNENGTTLANKYAPRLKYSVSTTSTNLTLSPDVVKVIGTASGNFSTVTTLSITALTTTGYGIPTITTTNGTCPANNAFVATYQVLFKAGSNCSLSIPGTCRWKDGLAPDPAAMAGKFCELTIMNNIATMNIVG